MMIKIFNGALFAALWSVLALFWVHPAFADVIVGNIPRDCTPRCASSMIFKATTRVAGSSVNFIPNFSHMVSRASDIRRTASGSNAWPERNPRIGMPFQTACRNKVPGDGIRRMEERHKRTFYGRKIPVH